MLAYACNGCHGVNGVGAGPDIPNLAGQPQEYLVSAMMRYKSGELHSTVMGRLAKGYSNSEIVAMASYFARQKPVSSRSSTDPALVSRGLKVFYKQCKYCHLDGVLWRQVHQYRQYEKECSKNCHLDYGPETNEEPPLIAGQWVEYLRLQLQEFKNGTRKMSPRKTKMLKSLSPSELEAVANFYASQTDLVR